MGRVSTDKTASRIKTEPRVKISGSISRTVSVESERSVGSAQVVGRGGVSPPRPRGRRRSWALDGERNEPDYGPLGSDEERDEESQVVDVTSTIHNF